MWLKRPIFLFIAHYRNLRLNYRSRYGCGTHLILSPICTLHWTLTYLGTSMYIGPHTCMSGYVSAYHGVGKLCILLHTILCHAVSCVLVIMSADQHAVSQNSLLTLNTVNWVLFGTCPYQTANSNMYNLRLQGQVCILKHVNHKLGQFTRKLHHSYIIKML